MCKKWRNHAKRRSSWTFHASRAPRPFLFMCRREFRQFSLLAKNLKVKLKFTQTRADFAQCTDITGDLLDVHSLLVKKRVLDKRGHLQEKAKINQSISQSTNRSSSTHSSQASSQIRPNEPVDRHVSGPHRASQ